MMAKHHPNEATLTSYAAGSLDEAMSVVIASHVGMCDQCRETVLHAEDMGGSLLEEMKPVEMASGSVNTLLERLDVQSRRDQTPSLAPKPANTMDENGAIIPPSLARLLDGNLSEIRWKKIAPGVAKYDLPVSEAASGKLYLLKIAPGRAVPDHGHDASELTLILQGSYSDRFGKFSRGDLADHDDDVEHQPMVDSDIDCICLIGMEGRLKFKGIIGRMMQPFIGV